MKWTLKKTHLQLPLQDCHLHFKKKYYIFSRSKGIVAVYLRQDMGTSTLHNWGVLSYWTVILNNTLQLVQDIILIVCISWHVYLEHILCNCCHMAPGPGNAEFHFVAFMYLVHFWWHCPNSKWIRLPKATWLQAVHKMSPLHLKCCC